MCCLVRGKILNLNTVKLPVSLSIGTLRYEDGKARTATAVDAGNFRGSRRIAKNKMLKMCVVAKDGDVNNSNLVQAFHRSNYVHYTTKEKVEILSY